MFARAFIFPLHTRQMNIKKTLKVNLHTLNRNSSVLGEMVGQRHLETVKVERGGEVGLEGWGVGVFLNQQKGFTLTHIPLVMTCRDTSKSKLLRGC